MPSSGRWKLANVHPSLFNGERITTGQLIGEVVAQPENTHAHIEVLAYSSNQLQTANPNLIYSRFGAVNKLGLENPFYIVDLMSFSGITKSATYTQFNSQPVMCGNQPLPQYPYRSYQTSTIGTLQFDHNVREDVDGQCFGRNGTIYSSNTCITIP